jgi:hypothetical protein
MASMILGGVSTLVELMIVIKIAVIRTAILKRPVLGIIFSLFLSYLIGHFFGASGTIILIAAVTSTLMSGIIYYAAERFEGIRDWFLNIYSKLLNFFSKKTIEELSNKYKERSALSQHSLVTAV